MSASNSKHNQCVECGTYLPEGDYFCSDACWDIWLNQSNVPLPPSKPFPMKAIDWQEIPF
jgi:Uncharacterized protein containing a Zn-ribbon (DUF2116)